MAAAPAGPAGTGPGGRAGTKPGGPPPPTSPRDKPNRPARAHGRS
jgi:hypothetical protein